MMDDGWDVTGDPVVDQAGYESPRHPYGVPHVERDWLAQADRDAEARRARRQQMRERNALPRERPRERWYGPAQQPLPPLPRPVTGPQPGQHGAYFERRMVRVWWAPWRKRAVWQQISTWQPGVPPRGAGEVVTVGAVAQLPGRVRTIGEMGPNGTVVY